MDLYSDLYVLNFCYLFERFYSINFQSKLQFTSNLTMQKTSNSKICITRIGMSHTIQFRKTKLGDFPYFRHKIQ